MQKRINWNNFRNNEPPVLDEVYIVRDSSGNIYLDKWIRKPFINCEGHLIQDKWLVTHRAYVEEWAFIDNVSLREYAELTELN